MRRPPFVSAFSEAFRGSERTLSVNNEHVQVPNPCRSQNGSRLRLKSKAILAARYGSPRRSYLTLSVDDHPVWRLEGERPAPIFLSVWMESSPLAAQSR